MSTPRPDMAMHGRPAQKELEPWELLSFRLHRIEIAAIIPGDELELEERESRVWFPKEIYYPTKLFRSFLFTLRMLNTFR